MTVLRRRLAWLIGTRVVVSTLLLGSAILVQFTTPGAVPTGPFFLLIGLTFALSLVGLLTMRAAGRARWLVDLQLGGDALLVSGFIYCTGGVGSYFSLLFVLPIIGASIVQARRGALMLAALSSILYVGLVAGQYVWLPFAQEPSWWTAVDLPPLRVAQYTVAINVFGFVGVGLLSGSLAERLRQADDRLERASSEIADLQAFNQHVIDSLLSGLITTDLQGRITSANRGAQQITGQPLAAVRGRPIAEVLQLPADLGVDFSRPLPAGRRRAEYTFARDDGRTLEIGLGITLLMTPEGTAGYLFAFQDVTEVKRLEREGRMRQRLAAVGEMAAGIAHEIRNPLASMAGSMQILRNELPLSDEQAQLMDIVLRESDRLNATIGSFLAYARPQRRGLSHLPLDRLLQDTAVLLRNSPEVLPAHTIEVDVLPPDLAMDADEGQVRQVVWNLATNGLRAMPQGGRLLLRARHVTAPDRDDHVCLEVDDEGVGIPSDQLDGIFQPFHGTFGRGTGLGLAIVHRIVSDYEGEVRVESQVGKGTRVLVKWPAGAVGSGELRVGSGERRTGHLGRGELAAPKSQGAGLSKPASSASRV